MTDVERGINILTKEERQRAVDALIGFFHTERKEEIGVVAAEEILDFLLQEVGPNVYNRAIDDALTAAKKSAEEWEYLFGELKR